LRVSLIGLATIALYKIAFTGFTAGPSLPGFLGHLSQEWVLLANLLALLTGFALLSRHFEESGVPEVLPRLLPHDSKGCFLLLVIVWVLSSFLDNIAGALIGGVMAQHLFRGKVHIGFLAAIVAASNAGGAWSVVGDTTTTMMWIAGIPPTQIFAAILPATVALFVFGIPAVIQQHKYSPIEQRSGAQVRIDWGRVGIVGLILVFAIATNVIVNIHFVRYAEAFPFLGVAVWVAILLTIVARMPDWKVLPQAVRGSIFLLALVLCASMMPVEKLPPASWHTAFGLGFISAVVDNIPLTALAIKQGGYDWSFLAYTVGFGGSMIWFASSSGVAISSMYRDVRSVGAWLRHAWYIVPAYVIGFFIMLAVASRYFGGIRRATGADNAAAPIGYRAAAYAKSNVAQRQFRRSGAPTTCRPRPACTVFLFRDSGLLTHHRRAALSWRNAGAALEPQARGAGRFPTDRWPGDCADGSRGWRLRTRRHRLGAIRGMGPSYRPRGADC
jgi:Na+/H+ antiporter NhaD/arsenite permease-like protein